VDTTVGGDPVEIQSYLVFHSSVSGGMLDYAGSTTDTSFVLTNETVLRPKHFYRVLASTVPNGSLQMLQPGISYEEVIESIRALRIQGIVK
jgi:hypothetical protein